MPTTISGSTGLGLTGSGNQVSFPDSSVQTTAATGFGFKNRIINGAMVIDQRNGGASVIPTVNPQYLVDRFSVENSVASKFAYQQNAAAVTPPVGFINYLGATSQSAYAIGAGDYFLLQQRIEGYNVADLGWGTANAKTITLSFWVRSSLTGTFGGNLQNAAANRLYPYSYTISAANTWEQKTITIAGDTSGTWENTSSTGILVRWSLGTGSTYLGTSGSWGSTVYLGVTGQVNVVGTSGATFYITGVQLEKGSTATSFDYRPYGMEFTLCQRYYQFSDIWANYIYIYGATIPANYGVKSSQFFTPMRAAPTVVAYNEAGTANRFSVNRGGAYTAGYIVNAEGFTMTNATGGGVGGSEVTFSWRASAEL